MPTMTETPEPAEPTRFLVDATEAGRIDVALARRYPGVGRRRLAELFAAGAIRIDGRKAKKGDRVAAGVAVEIRQPLDDAAARAALPDPDVAYLLTVLHADATMVVVAKPPGMASHPLQAGEKGTAANGLLALYPACAGVGDDPREAGLVHRLDGGTSGALVCALDRPSWQRLRAAFASGGVDKEYVALVEGFPSANGCEAPLLQAGSPGGARSTVDGRGLEASTTWEVAERFEHHTLLRCHARTGRMHQVRAHLAHCGTPIAGDTLYGGAPLAGLEGFFLHAASLVLPLPHPVAGQSGVRVEAPLPPDRVASLARLRASVTPARG